jgi:hypothetical protein
MGILAADFRGRLKNDHGTPDVTLISIIRIASKQIQIEFLRSFKQTSILL